jgi:FkbM family methyltransferase
MNKGRPIAALYRFAKWQVQSRLQDEVIFDWIDGAKLAVRRGMTGATGNIYCGLHEYVDMRFVLDNLKPNDLFVDIGANVGSYTVLASKVCKARTICVEPDPETVDLLRRNIAVNGIDGRVEVINSALGAELGVINFTIGLDTTNRVATADDAEVRQVPVKTLDSILKGRCPTIIKIDVEGYELEVFKGATRTLADLRLTAIITETLDPEVLSILSNAGFHQAWYDPNTKTVTSSRVYASHNSLMLRKKSSLD